MNRFWTGYILFFIFIFPMIFEYLPWVFSGNYGFGTRTSPWMAIAYLAVGTIAWICFIFWSYRSFIRPVSKQYNDAKSIVKEGIPVVAHVEKKSIKKETDAYQVLDLEISLQNLSGTLIRIPYEINDTRSEKKRFEVGEFIKMRMDPKLRPPIIVPEDVQVKESNNIIGRRYGAFVGLIAFAMGYLIFSYWLQNGGNGWRFLHFWHPWVTIPFWGLFFGVLIVNVVMGGFLGSFFGGTNNEMKLVFKGKPAHASVIDASQTGTYINEQPQIKFKVEFLDDSGQLRTASFKKIVSLLDLHKIDREERIILYLPENPSEVIFAEEYVQV